MSDFGSVSGGIGGTAGGITTLAGVSATRQQASEIHRNSKRAAAEILRQGREIVGLRRRQTRRALSEQQAAFGAAGISTKSGTGQVVLSQERLDAIQADNRVIAGFKRRADETIMAGARQRRALRRKADFDTITGTAQTGIGLAQLGFGLA